MSHAAVDKSLSVVPETRFGRWFLRTNIWARYVVEAALDEFTRQLPATLERPRRILDAGCGAGVSLPLVDRRLHPDCIVALDIDPGEVGRCRRQAAGCRSELRLVVGDAASLALPDESVDLVLCHQMLHHARRQEAILREFHRVLVPGGWLLLEHGAGQHEAVRALLEAAGLETTESWPDLAGIPRVSGGKR